MNEFAVSPSSAPWFLFDNSNGAPDSQTMLLKNSVRVIRADTAAQVPTALEQLRQAIDEGLYAAGFFSYELGYVLEASLRSLMPSGRQVPLIWFALYSRIDNLSNEEADQLLQQQTKGQGAGSLGKFRQAVSKKDYLHRFAQVKDLIASGDVYQVNLAFKLAFDYTGSPVSIYQKLRQQQPVSFGAYLQAPDFSILSLSPELFFEIKDGKIATRPMKGTMKRGADKGKDRQLVRQLQQDAKNRAENLMIVDLMRNDFSRICEVGSVEVNDLYHIETYPTLHQMTSDVRGCLRENVRLEDIIKALVPAGSITGAPKIRAQEIIRELEDEPRGLYCGAMGVLGRDKGTGQLKAMFNVAIRTLTLFPDGQGEAGIGSGVVQDSVGEDEYEECLLKARFMTCPDFKLIETMHLDPDEGYYLLELHLNRLQRSSEELGFACPLEECRKELLQLEKTIENGCHMVRLLLAADGRFGLTSTPIASPDPDRVISFTLSDKCVSSSDDLLAHKTTRRQLFDEEWRRAYEQEGVDEILFLNERGELTEGSRSNLFVERDGKLATPPLSCGLLPGTLRQHLMSEGRVVEAVLKRKDLKGAKIWLGNSVRGLQPAHLLVK